MCSVFAVLSWYNVVLNLWSVEGLNFAHYIYLQTMNKDYLTYDVHSMLSCSWLLSLLLLFFVLICTRVVGACYIQKHWIVWMKGEILWDY
mgnify:CR=1 FL=1